MPGSVESLATSSLCTLRCSGKTSASRCHTPHHQELGRSPSAQLGTHPQLRQPDHHPHRPLCVLPPANGGLPYRHQDHCSTNPPTQPHHEPAPTQLELQRLSDPKLSSYSFANPNLPWRLPGPLGRSSTSVSRPRVSSASGGVHTSRSGRCSLTAHRGGALILDESRPVCHDQYRLRCSSVAQSVEHPAVNRRVVGSSPT